jgi:hypothetical protein
MDNRIFNVNGEGDELLAKTLELAFIHGNHGMARTAEGWSFTKKHGLILHWTIMDNPKDVHKFPGQLSAEDCLPFVKAWLKSADAKTVEKIGEDSDYDHDGSNHLGWRVFCESWGHVNSDWSAFIAIKPAYMWYGK